MSKNLEFSIDSQFLLQHMKEKGFRSIKELSEETGLHRNTISGYLNGDNIFPRSFESLLDVLELEPGRVLKTRRIRKRIPGLQITPLVEKLVEEPKGCA